MARGVNRRIEMPRIASDHPRSDELLKNPHTEIEATRSGSDENSAAAKAFRHIDELAATMKCSCEAGLERHVG